MINQKVSIIVVSLNTKHLFLKTVISAIAQSYKEKEIIVVDGNSSDGTADIIKKMKKHFSKIIIEKDQGIYDAMNKGSRLASGGWIIYLNSGDVFFNKNVLSCIFQQSFKNKDILFGNTFVKNKGVNYFLHGKFFSQKTIYMPFCHQSVLVKTSIIKKNKFSLKYRYASDFNFFLRCFARKKIFYDTKLTIATVLAQGLSDKNRQKVYRENIKILSKYGYGFSILARLWFLKFFNFIKDCIKYILPQSIILIILKFKYRKRLK